MIGPPSGTSIWIVAGFTDLRRGFDALSAQIQNVLQENPFSGELYVFRGRRGDRIKVLWYSEDGLCLFYKRLSDGSRSVSMSPRSPSPSINSSGCSMVTMCGR